MRTSRSFMFGAAMAATALCPAVALATEPDALALHFKWRAELDGPIKRCKVPDRILFLANDAIITGKIIFRNKTYTPSGRLEDTLETELFLVRRYGDPKPLVALRAKADGRWNGKWAAAGEDCAGRVRIVPR
jgi:hypothetical protein